MWTLEGIRALRSTAQGAWSLKMEDTGNEVARALGEECAGPGMWGYRLPSGWCVAAGERGVQAQVRRCADPRKGPWVEVVRAWSSALGLRPGLASSSPSLPQSPLPSAPSGCLWAGSRKLQAFVSNPGAWEEVGRAVSPMGGGAVGEGRIGDSKEWGPRVGLRAQDLSGVHTPFQWPQGRKEVRRWG